MKARRGAYKEVPLSPYGAAQGTSQFPRRIRVFGSLLIQRAHLLSPELLAEVPHEEEGLVGGVDELAAKASARADDEYALAPALEEVDDALEVAVAAEEVGHVEGVPAGEHLERQLDVHGAFQPLPP